MQEKSICFHITLPMEFPDDWSDSQINFHLNNSSWCMSNLIELLEKYDEEHGCICNICKAEVLKTE